MVSWFIPLQSNSQNSHQTRWKTCKENSRSLLFFVSSSSSLLSSHVLITLFGSPSPHLVVRLNVTKLWGVGLVNLSYMCDCVMRFVSPTHKNDIARQRVLSSSRVRASKHGGLWVRIPSGAQIFSVSSYCWFFVSPFIIINNIIYSQG